MKLAHLRLIGCSVIVLAAASWVGLGYAVDPPRSEPTGSLPAEVRAVFTRNKCLTCHDGETKKGDLDLGTPATYLKADSEVVVAGKATESTLIQKVESGEMPPKKNAPPMSDADKKILRDWVSGMSQPSGGAAEAAADILKNRCDSCHGISNPKKGLTILDVESHIKFKRVVPGNPDASPLMWTLDPDLAQTHGRSMMPPGQNSLTKPQIDVIRRWIREGAKPFTREVEVVAGQTGAEYVMTCILKDVQSLGLAGKDIGRYRYFSLNHLIVAGITESQLQLHRDAFTLVVNHLSQRPDFVVPVPLDPAKTVFRLDTEDLGWNERYYVSADKKSSPLRVHDLLLLEYPYGQNHGQSNAYQALRESYTDHKSVGMVRPIPYMHADWVTINAAISPLYEDIMRLPVRLDGLEQRLLGRTYTKHDVEAETVKAVRAGNRHSGVSTSNRLIERLSRDGYYWASYDFADNNADRTDFFHNPFAFKEAGGEMIFRLPNGLQGYYVCDSDRKRLVEAPTKIVTDRHAANQTVRNALSCIRCHDEGIKSYTDQVRKTFGGPGTAKIRDLQIANRVYPEQTALDRVFSQDAKSFSDALIKLFDGKRVSPYALTSAVAGRHQDGVVTARWAGAELGLVDETEVAVKVANNALAFAGLPDFADAGGGMKRDAWEARFGAAVRVVGRGEYIPPADSVRTLEYAQSRMREIAPEVEEPLRIDTLQLRPDGKEVKGLRLFRAGDKVRITVTNSAAVRMYVEVIVVTINGEIYPVSEGVHEVPAGGAAKFPNKDGIYKDGVIDFEPGTGDDTFILFAGEHPFPAGVIHEFPGRKAGAAPYEMADRFVHPEPAKILAKCFLKTRTTN